MQRFWSKVDIQGEYECWPWTAGIAENGYGRFWIEGRTQPAHRMAFLLEYGPVPPELQIRHMCRRRFCCNPEHLGIGTDSDNKRDAIYDKTTPRRSLTDSQVLQIFLDKGPRRKTALLFGCSVVQVGRIQRGERRLEVIGELIQWGEAAA